MFIDPKTQYMLYNWNPYPKLLIIKPKCLILSHFVHGRAAPSKDSKSSDSSSSARPRKRSTRPPPGALSPAKKPRPAQGRDYDLNEIRSELKGLHSVKQEPEDVKQEEKDQPDADTAAQPEKQAEDVYEFKVNF